MRQKIPKNVDPIILDIALIVLCIIIKIFIKSYLLKYCDPSEHKLIFARIEYPITRLCNPGRN